MQEVARHNMKSWPPALQGFVHYLATNIKEGTEAKDGRPEASPRADRDEAKLSDVAMAAAALAKDILQTEILQMTKQADDRMSALEAKVQTVQRDMIDNLQHLQRSFDIATETRSYDGDPMVEGANVSAAQFDVLCRETERLQHDLVESGQLIKRLEERLEGHITEERSSRVNAAESATSALRMSKMLEGTVQGLRYQSDEFKSQLKQLQNRIMQESRLKDYQGGPVTARQHRHQESLASVEDQCSQLVTRVGKLEEAVASQHRQHVLSVEDQRIVAQRLIEAWEESFTHIRSLEEAVAKASGEISPASAHNSTGEATNFNISASQTSNPRQGRHSYPSVGSSGSAASLLGRPVTSTVTVLSSVAELPDTMPKASKVATASIAQQGQGSPATSSPRTLYRSVTSARDGTVSSTTSPGRRTQGQRNLTAGGGTTRANAKKIND